MDITSKDEGEIIGYADPWIASPGQRVSVKVSCASEACRLDFGWNGRHVNAEISRSPVPFRDSRGRSQE